MLEASFGNKRKYKYKIVRHSEGQYVHFKQINSNVTDVVGQLDEIRSDPRWVQQIFFCKSSKIIFRKFICLNDNLDYTRGSENDFVNSLLYDFYLSLFPFPSEYELPRGYRNRFLHVEELQDWKTRHYRIKIMIFIFGLFVLYMVGFKNILNRICVVINKFYWIFFIICESAGPQILLP